jgi:hypothetical protein
MVQECKAATNSSNLKTALYLFSHAMSSGQKRSNPKLPYFVRRFATAFLTQFSYSFRMEDVIQACLWISYSKAGNNNDLLPALDWIEVRVIVPSSPHGIQQHHEEI